MIQFEEQETRQVQLKVQGGINAFGLPLVRDAQTSDLVLLFKQNPELWAQVKAQVEEASNGDS